MIQATRVLVLLLCSQLVLADGRNRILEETLSLPPNASAYRKGLDFKTARRVRETPRAARLVPDPPFPKPIQWAQSLFAKHVYPHLNVQGLDGKSGIFVLNHAYKSGLDGFIFVHLLALKTGKLPKVLITGEQRGFFPNAQRWILSHYGVAIIVPPELPAGAERDPRHQRLTDIMADVLKKEQNIVIFPAGKAKADPRIQIKNWSTSFVMAAQKSGRDIIPVGMGGAPLDWSSEDAVLADHRKDPYRFFIKIGPPIRPPPAGLIDPEAVAAIRDRTALAVECLMREIPGLWPADPDQGTLNLRDGSSLAYLVRDPNTDHEAGSEIINVFYMHGFQGSRLDSIPDFDAILKRQRVRWIAVDRPGIGLSTPKKKQTLEDGCRDIAALAEALIPGQPFSILAVSAGTAYAMAWPAAIDKTSPAFSRLQSLTLVSPIRLPSFVSSMWNFRMEDKKMLLAARYFPRWFVRKILRARTEQVLYDWPAHSEQTMKKLNADDRRILGRPDVNALVRNARQEGYRQGASHIQQDVRAMMTRLNIRPKYFSNIPVHLWHGVKDSLATPRVSAWLHRWFPRSELHLLSGRGHYFIYEEVEPILAALRHTHLTGQLTSSVPMEAAA